MIIFYYDLLCGSNQGTASSHINEVTENIKRSGNEILFSDLEPTNDNKLSNPNNTLTIWGRLGKRWPLLGIMLVFMEEIRFYLKGILALKKTHHPDIVYYRNSMFNAGFWTANFLKVPAVKEINGIITSELQVTRPISKLTLSILNYIEHRNMPKADLIITVTSKLKDVLIKEYNVPHEKIIVLENGVNVDLFRPLDSHDVKRELELDNKIQYICYSGNFAAWQGLEYLVKCIPQALVQCPNTCFLFVGDGELKDGLVEMASDLNVIDKIIFTGMVPYTKVPLYINASDICVVPKIPLESGYSPLKLCEYLACEKPVIASNISGLEIIEEFNMGLLVPAEDEISLAKAIIKLLNDPDLGKAMGNNGRRYVVENRSWEKVASKIIKHMERLVANRPPRIDLQRQGRFNYMSNN